MADMNPFDLLGADDSAEDPSQLIAAQQQKVAVGSTAQQPKKGQAQPKAAAPSAKLPSKPVPPTQAVREARVEATRGRGRGGGRGYGRGRSGGGGFNREPANDENAVGNRQFSGVQGASEEGDERKPFERRGDYGGPRGDYGGPRGSFRGGRRGGYNNGDAGEGERPRRVFERRSGTGRGNEVKREGAGRGNWGTPSDELDQLNEEAANEGERALNPEKPSGQEDAEDGDKDGPVGEAEQKEPEDKEMTLEEYEKVLEEKRKALQALKTAEERKVDAKEFESMQLLNKKKSNDDIFVKLGSDKDKRKESIEKEEKAKKSVSINEFLKPAEGERYYNPGGRGRGRGRGRGAFGGGTATNVETPAIEDPGQFPSLGGK